MKNRLLNLGWFQDENGNWIEPKEQPDESNTDENDLDTADQQPSLQP